MSDILHHFVDIRSELTSPVTKDSYIKGKCVLDASLLNKLQTLSKQGAASEFVVVDGREKEVRELDIKDGKGAVEAQIKLFPSELESIKEKEQRAHYFETMSNLVEEFKVESPGAEYYVHGEVRGFSSDTEKRPQIANYEKTVRLIELLSSLAVFEERRSGTKVLYFFQESKVEVPVEYESDAFIELADFDQLKIELSREDEKDTRTEVFINTLVGELQGVASNRRFRHILKEFDSICHKY